ncbi:hypothetical protein IMSAGC004_00100 [Bacteroidaceae bacterium]|nr:hypothetical protein IMSAGC004_00100 [Bacteroidaceae bacterium]
MNCQKYSILYMFCIKIKKEEKPPLGILPPNKPAPEPPTLEFCKTLGGSKKFN